jgi:hypothetical protein
VTEGHEAAANKAPRSESRTIFAKGGQMSQLLAILINQC